MEISNEIKTKIFAQHIGQKVQVANEKYINNGYIGTILGVCSVRGILVKNPCGSDGDENINDCKLVLKPLSLMTKEDTLEVVKMFGFSSNIEEIEKFEKQTGEDYVSTFSEIFYKDGNIGVGNYKDTLSMLNAWQYFQDMGYDIPQRLLGGKTLRESGLAIYE